MNSLDRFSVLTNEQASTTVGGSWQTELAKFIAEQAANHIDDIVRGFNAGNHRHRPQGKHIEWSCNHCGDYKTIFM